MKINPGILYMVWSLIPFFLHCTDGDFRPRMSYETDTGGLPESPGYGLVFSLKEFGAGGRGRVSEEWVSMYDGTAQDYDQAKSLALDSSGNLFVTGYSYGEGTFFDFSTVKYDSDGNELWVATYNGPGNYSDRASGICLDGNGAVYVTGGSYGYGTGCDCATIKYDTDGEELWTTRFNASVNGYDFASDLATDAAGNVYITGYTWNGDNSDYATIKYDTDGNELWSAIYDGPINGSDYAEMITRDPNGDIYVTGRSPGDGTLPDFATIKYDSDGNEIWTARFDGSGSKTDFPMSMAADSGGNVYITGYSYSVETGWDYATVKYDTAGNELWRATYNGPANRSDYAVAITVDPEGNAYVTGSTNTNWIYYDFATIKYDPYGNELWIAYYDGTAEGGESPRSITMDTQGYIYVSGESRGSGTGDDVVTLKYDDEGVEQWVIRYNGTENDDDNVRDMVVDGNGNVYLTGFGWNGISQDYLTIKYNQREPFHAVPFQF